MSKIDESIGFYRKMSDLQERLRRSEEERLQLEEKFALLTRACRDEEEARLNDLRERYESFLEEEKQRRERNDRILQTLDRIESRAAILTAKSERLKLLRRHYEVYVLRMYPGWKYVTNKFLESQPSTPKFDPLHNKLNLEADRNHPYSEPGSSPLFPADYSRRSAAPTFQHNYSTVGIIPSEHQPIPVSRTAVDTAPATGTVDRLQLPRTSLPVVNVVDKQQKPPNSVVTVGEHTVSQKAPQETSGSSQNSKIGKMESNKMDQLDDYLGRAAEMLKLSRADDALRDKTTSKHLDEINPDSLKDTKNLGNSVDFSLKDNKNLGNSVDFELEQNTSGDLLNASLSDDGVLQEETNRTLVSFGQKGDENKNINRGEGVNKDNDVNNKDVLMNKKSQPVENSVDNKDILLNKNVQDFHQASKLTPLEEKNQETMGGGGGDAQNLRTAFNRKGEEEFSNPQQLYQKNATLIGGGDSVIQNKKMYPNGRVLETEEQSGLSQRKQQYSNLNDGIEKHAMEQIQGIEISEQDSRESAYGNEGDAEIDNIDKSSGQELVGNKLEETSGNESSYRADQENEEEQSGDQQYTEQKQWDESDQQNYQQEGDQYFQYGEDGMYQQSSEGEYGQQYVDQQGGQYAEQLDGEQPSEQYGQQCEDQEGMQYDQQSVEQQAGQYDQQYADQLEGQYDQQYEDQQEGQYDQQYADQQEGQYDEQEGLYDQQEEQYAQQSLEQQAGQYDQQYVDQLEGQYDQQYADQQEGQYDQQNADQQEEQYDQQYEDYQHQKQKDSQLLPEEQQVREEGQTVRHEGHGDQEDNGLQRGLISEEQQPDIHGDKQENAGDASDRCSSEDGKYQEQVYEETQDDEGKGGQKDETAVAGEEKILSKVAEDKNSTALPKQPDVSSDLADPSSSGNVEQYHQLLDETGEPEQSDTDELELQLAELVESKQHGEKLGKQLQQSVPSEEKAAKQRPAKILPSAVENIGDNTTSTESSKNMEELAKRTDIKTSEVVGHEETVQRNRDSQPKIPQTSSKPESEPVAVPKEADAIKTTQSSINRPGSKKLPGLTKMLESDTESLQLDATVSNEDSDDFDFSSDK